MNHDSRNKSEKISNRRRRDRTLPFRSRVWEPSCRRCPEASG